jgi:hypothetical protein
MTSDSKKPLRPEDFPVDVEGQKIKKQDGTPIADAESPAVAAEIAERLNEDEASREEDKWSARGMKAAIIEFSGHAIACLVRNQSETGAALELGRGLISAQPEPD